MRSSSARSRAASTARSSWTRAPSPRPRARRRTRARTCPRASARNDPDARARPRHGVSTRRLVLYEDRHWRSLRPLTDLLPVPALAFGASDLARRWLAHAQLPLHAIEARAGAMAGWHDVPPLVASGTEPEAVVINAAALPGPWFAEALGARAPSLWMGDGRIAGARLPLASLRGGLGRGEDFETVLLGLGLPAVPVDAEFVTWPWDLIARNAAAIEHDLASVRAEVRGAVHLRACLESP